MEAGIRKNERGTLELMGKSRAPLSPSVRSDVEPCKETWKKLQGNQKLEELHVAVEGSGAVCVLVQGPCGCGKSSLLREYAALCGRTGEMSPIVIHLGEQIDSKMLLGTFTCTSVPGEFVWLPGLLTKCVLAGQWMVMEDVDSAPPDVISLLLPLVKNKRLNLPGYYEPVVAAPGFKLFLTRRVHINNHLEASYHHSGLQKVLQQQCITFSLPHISHDEVQKIISKQYPSLEIFSKPLALAVTEHNISLWHILKLCRRISQQVVYGRLTSVPDMMLDVVDCFAGHLSGEKKIARAMQLSYLCGGLSQDMVDQLCINHKPSVQISPTTVSVGRAYLHCTQTAQPKVCYSHTQSSLSLLEGVCRCVEMSEPVLLVGETGVGKTATVNYLAHVTGHKLVVLNMSQQTDSMDLLGGYKPVQMVHVMTPLKVDFEALFRVTFSLKHNALFLTNLQTCLTKHQWKKLLKLMLHSFDSAQKRTKNTNKALYGKWQELGAKLKKLRKQIVKSQVFAFTFDNGALVEAVCEGWWILLDEINLASPETLQCLSGVLETQTTPLLFMERLDSKPVKRHADFRLFCCMNPSTDVGKKSLPENIRNRFTEFYVDEPKCTSDLSVLIQDYLKNELPSTSLVEGIVRLYRSLKILAETKLLDGTGRAPHYSLRNLCRALQYAANHICGSFHKSLYEGFCLSFLTELCQQHHHTVMVEIVKCLALPDAALTSPTPAPNADHSRVVQVSGFWLTVGSEAPYTDEKYILTPSVKRNLHNLARVVSARKYPVLLQGPTSAGKTSLVQYLAKHTGHQCLRINNHEHTDLQEYIGMYTADSHGELYFQEGVLVEAMRKGYWVILDELNLAPTDVLEALNRVLDDNRELYIPETRELVKAHPHFILFGTQNPPGIYGGRKVLSRAFRNRFMELHYDDIPASELVTILQDKCQLPASYAKKMVAVMKELQERRTSSCVFAGKYGLITLRDLFRWAERYRRSPTTSCQFRDWEQQLAEDGYMLLAGRLREAADEQVVLDVIQMHFKRRVQPQQLFGQDGGLASRDCLQLLCSPLPEAFSHLVWTAELLRMAVLAYRAVSFDEPVLLVGNTGCGKTTLCQLFSCLLGREFLSINCHMHTEAADFLGGLKPTRSTSASASHSGDGKVGLFEWKDGVVVRAMQDGCCLLVDEISLADDAVLERLNSVLESERRLLVSERSRSQSQNEVFQITATNGFVFMATMNPGGDYGKKELSPALRNRFVEIWCQNSTGEEDLCRIINHNLKLPVNPGVPWCHIMLRLMQWVKKTLPLQSCELSVRDLLSWVHFMNTTSPPLTPAEAFYHGAHLVFLDGLGCSGQITGADKEEALVATQLFLQDLLTQIDCDTASQQSSNDISAAGDQFGIHPFFIRKGPYECKQLLTYTLEAPGPRANALRLLRGMQVGRPLLIEGPPGVGKTSLVTALASASGHHLTRINLSEHTDISDLFGCDLPVEGGKWVQFAWRDGPLLRALRRGDWVLLDEINLASQSVLEGLNAVLDHRAEVFIPELGMQFSVQPGTKLFACQNPVSQGGGRKGLPKSFLNRFTKVFIDMLSDTDLLFVTEALYPSIESHVLQNMISFNRKVEELVRKEHGANLWEFNLRDILRWCQLMKEYQVTDPGQFVDLIYCQRLRSASLRTQVVEKYCDVFGNCQTLPSVLGGYVNISDNFLQIGHSVLTRHHYFSLASDNDVPLQFLHCQLPILEAVMMCVERGWMTILVGEGGSGKSSVVSTLAMLMGHKLVEFPMNSDTDTTELLGGFQQVNFSRHCTNLTNMVMDMFRGLMSGLHSHQSDAHYITKLLSVQNTQLPDTSSLLQDFSHEELLLRCAQLKECLLVVEDISTTLQIPLPYSVEEIVLEVTKLMEKVQEVNSGGQFEWVDSILVTALRYGYWVSITNCNFCNPSVLDRLNPLMEPDGMLYIDERGIVGDGIVAVTPHPDFRLFLVMDPKHGEISRAMRNRGIEICILSEETLASVGQHRDDWRSLLSDAGLDSHEAEYIVETCSTNYNPVRILQGLRCNTMIHQMTDVQPAIWKYLDVPPPLASMEVTDKVRSAPPPVPLSVTCTQPHLIMARSHFSAVLQTINQHITKTGSKKNSPLLDVRAALQVFTDHAALHDYQERVQLLANLRAPCSRNSSNCITGEIRAASAALDIYAQNRPQLTVRRGAVTCDLNQFCVSTNPLTTDTLLDSVILESRRTILAGRIRAQQEFVEWFSGFDNSALRVSHRAYTGQVHLESLVHPSLQYVQPLFTTLLHHLSTMFEQHTAILTENDTVEKVMEWLSVMMQCFSCPIHSVTELAVLWTMLRAQCLLPLSLHTTNSILGVYVNNLHPLETIVQHCRFFAVIRDGLDLSAYSVEDYDPIALSDELKRVHSVTCFKLLTITSSRDTLCSIDGPQCKIDQLHKLLQWLWLSGCSFHNSPIANLQKKLELARCILESSVMTLANAVKQSNATFSDDTSQNRMCFPLQDSVPDMCLQAEKLCPVSTVFWQKLSSEIEEALGEIASIRRKLEAEYDVVAGNRDHHGELELLCGLSRCCVHIGVVLNQLLLPTTVDPVSMKMIMYQCHQILAEQQRVTMEACNRHYITTTGQSLTQLLKAKSSVYTFLPGVRGGVAPYVLSAVRRSKECDELLHGLNSLSINSNSRRKYSSLVSQCTDVVHTLCSPLRVASLQQDAATGTSDALLRVEAWSRALSSAIQKLNSEEYSALSDVLLPFSVGLKHILAGVKALASLKASLQSPHFPLVPIIKDLTQFPFFTTANGSGSAQFIQTLLDAIQLVIGNHLNTSQKQQLQKRMLLVGVQSCHKYISTTFTSNSCYRVPERWLILCASLLKCCWSLWDTSEKILRAKTEEESSLYRYKTHMHVISAEEDCEREECAVKQLFPLYDSEFEEYSEEARENEMEDVEKQEVNADAQCQFTCKEMEEVSNLHQLVFTASLPNSSHQCCTVVKSKYAVSASLAGVVGHIPGLSTDYCIFGGHVQMCSTVLNELTNVHQGKESNVYKEAVVCEAKRAGPVIASLKNRVQELLEEWPDHPGLLQVLKACDRVLSLSVQEPLMKVLAGLEYILRKAQDWEEYAASHVSLCSQLEALTHLILDWRRMELKSWQSLLDDCSSEVQCEASKWWFHVYSLCQECIHNGLVNVQEFLTSVHKFVEVAPLGEYSVRLNVLRAFSTDIYLQGHCALGNILRNSVYYYEQFLPAVLSHTKQCTAGVEKEFQEHMRIMRWNDGNYWALKASTEKSHRTLVKFKKKWKAVLQESVHPLLRAGALQQGAGDGIVENALETICRKLHASTTLIDIKFTENQLSKLDRCLLKEIPTLEQGRLTVGMVLRRMSALLQEFSSTDTFNLWNSTVDDLAGEIVATVKKLQSEDFLKGLEGDRRKSAIKLNCTQKRISVTKLFKYLKKQGLSHHNEVDFNASKILFFQLPVIQDNTALGLPTILEGDIQKYFYRCVGRLAGLQAAFVTPTKDLPVAQLRCCRGYTGRLVRIVCEQRKTLSSATQSLNVLQYLLEQLRSLVDGEVYTFQTTEYATWQKTLLAVVEMSLELISDFEALVATLPDNIDTWSCRDSPPILACGNKSIANTALAMLKAERPALHAVFEQLLVAERKQTCKESLLVSRSEVIELVKVCSLLEQFSGKILDVLDICIGSKTRRVGMLEFLEAAELYFSATCQKYRKWMGVASVSMERDVTKNVVDGLHDNRCASVMRELLLSVQRVMVRSNKCAGSTEQREGDLLDFPCCVYLHLTTTNNLTDMNMEKVIEKFIAVLPCTKEEYSEEVVKSLFPVLPLVQHYTTLLRMLLLKLALAHRTFCKLLSILLALFSDLVSKGICIPPDVEQVGEEAGTKFEAAEGGGFDEGVGTKNVSGEVDAEDLEELTDRSEERDGSSDQQVEEGGDQAVDMSEEFGGDVTDLPEARDSDNESEGEEEDEYENTLGDLGADGTEHIDRNMWAPEEKQENDEQRQSEEQGGGNSEYDEARIAARDEHSKLCESDNQPLQKSGTTNEDTGNIQEEDISCSCELNESDVAEHEQVEDMEQEHKNDYDVDDLHQNEREAEDMSSNSGECNESGIVVREEEQDGEKNEEGQPELCAEEKQQNVQAVNSDVTSVQSMEANSQFGVEVVSPDDLPPNSTQHAESMEQRQDGKGTEPNEEHQAGNGVSTVAVAAANESSQEEHHGDCKMHPRPQEEECSLAGQEEKAIKRPRLMQDRTDRGQTTHDAKQALEYKHMREGEEEHDGIVWDAAPLSSNPGNQPPSDLTDTDNTGIDSTNAAENRQQPLCEMVVPICLKERSNSDNILHELMETEADCVEEEVAPTSTPQPYSQLEPHSFFATIKHHMHTKMVEDETLRQLLKEDIKVLHSENKDMDVHKMWQKYEALMSSLSHSLCEELRLVLQPTQTAQLRGDYRTGKRLNMRRIIPYIASHFQNDHIWLRRTKPSKRDYQVLMAVDDSASMSENECSQMAYESLAMISSALSLLDCGQLGILRFGADVDLLHSFDQPFSVATGAHLLQHLSFSQTSTNFVEMLWTSHSLFTQSFEKRRGQSSSLTSQLLLVLSDGRGVFANGTTAVEVAIRKLNDLGVLTVFVILDSLSKGSVMSIKVPSFLPGKAPVVKSYLETFPFSFYIVLQDIKSLPVVLGKALQQWFELLSGQ